MIYEYTETQIIRNKVEILPCPFCGSENVKPIHYTGSYGYSASEDYVKCLNCSATGGLIKNDNGLNRMEDAIRRWNRRAYKFE